MKKLIAIEVETNMTNDEVASFYEMHQMHIAVPSDPNKTVDLTCVQVMVMQIQPERTEQDDD